jgi:hypothetical protein
VPRACCCAVEVQALLAWENAGVRALLNRTRDVDAFGEVVTKPVYLSKSAI